jgi:hypothetical protein
MDGSLPRCDPSQANSSNPSRLIVAHPASRTGLSSRASPGEVQDRGARLADRPRRASCAGLTIRLSCRSSRQLLALMRTRRSPQPANHAAQRIGAGGVQRQELDPGHEHTVVGALDARDPEPFEPALTLVLHFEPTNRSDLHRRRRLDQATAAADVAHGERNVPDQDGVRHLRSGPTR